MSSNYPTKTLTVKFLNELSNFLFPVCREMPNNNGKTDILWQGLQLQMRELLYPLKPLLKANSDEIVQKYFEQIPAIYDSLLEDAEAIYRFDPAAHSQQEIILSYPGFEAILTYRLAHPLYKLQVPILPRLMSEHAHGKTGIDIHPGATIGRSFFIDHGTGIVIGETTQIGDHVKIYQGVTLGALSVKKDEARIKRHPTIGNNTIIYSGATILGGNTHVGHDSIIGGNVWLTQSVEPHSIVYHTSEIKVKQNGKFPEPINFVI